jgi:hypothetical protein
MKAQWCGPLVVGAAIAGLALSPLSAEQDKDPTIKEIMKKAHKGDDSLLQTLGRDLKKDKPDWDAIQMKTKELVQLGTALGKNAPPMGDQDSWEAQTTRYLRLGQAMEDYVRAQDQAKAAGLQMRLSRSCENCHKAHKK